MRILVLMSLLLSFSLYADVEVRGAQVSDSGCAYFSTVTGHYVISYIDRDHDTRWGDRVYIQYGFHDVFSQRIWTREKSLEMTNAGPYEWNVQVNEVVASRGSFSADQLDFIIRIEHEDGTKTFLNGNGSSWGYYYVELKQTHCSFPSELDKMSVISLVKN